MPASIALREGMAKAFNALASEFLPAVNVFLLKPSEVEDEYTEVLEIESKWFFEYSDYRKRFLLEIAEDTDELSAAIKEATHVQVDDYVYVIDNGDTVEPQGVNPVWQLFCELFEKRGHYTEL